MKSTERHRLKENELASTVTRVRETIDTYQKPILAGVVAVVILIVAAVGYTYWRSQADASARSMVADALTIERAPVAPAPVPGAAAQPPAQPGSYPTEKARNEAALAKFMAVADAYPSSPAGLEARYHAAALLTELGRTTDAVQRYQEVVDRAGSGVYGQMAKLGIAEAQVAAGQFDKGIATFAELATRKDGDLPVDGILMQLARAYGSAGKGADARQTFKRIVDEYPQSPFAAEARRAMEQIKG